MSTPTTNSIVPTHEFSLADILQYTEPKQPGASRRILGSLAGGAANAFVPGVGTLIGNMIGGALGLPGGGGLLGGETTQFLQLQKQIQEEARTIEFISALLKVRHETEMDVIRNIK